MDLDRWLVAKLTKFCEFINLESGTTANSTISLLPGSHNANLSRRFFSVLSMRYSMTLTSGKLIVGKEKFIWANFQYPAWHTITAVNLSTQIKFSPRFNS